MESSFRNRIFFEEYMKQRTFLVAAMLSLALVAFSTMGFQCSSPDVTSGKLYYQQYQSSKNVERLEQARAAFEKEVQNNPNSGEGWYWLGIVQGEMRQYLSLHQSWQKAKQYGKSSDIDQNTYYFWGQAFNYGADRLRRAQIRQDKAGYAEAAESFKAATLLMPDSSAVHNAYVYLAVALKGSGDITGAEKPLLEQIKRNPIPEAYSELGQLYIRKGNELRESGQDDAAMEEYTKALALLDEAVGKYPDNAELNNELLNVYIATDRVTEAVAKFREYADNNPGDGSAQYAAGTALLQISQYENASVYLERAIELDKKNTNALYNCVVCYLRWGISLRDEDESSDPTAPQSNFRDIIRKSLHHLDILLELQPDNFGNWDLAGRVYASVGMTKEAEEAYKKADELRDE